MACWRTIFFSEGSESRNQDAGFLFPIFSNSLAVVVADGVGGQAGGQEAAHQAVQMLAEFFCALKETPTPNDIQRWLVDVDFALRCHADAGLSTAIKTVLARTSWMLKGGL